jgi:DNA processing protein
VFKQLLNLPAADQSLHSASPMRAFNLEVSWEELIGPLNDVEQKFAPPKVFVSGETSILLSGFRVSMVGSRKASARGEQRARRLAQLVCGRGGVVVSGLAEGIDTAAHKGAIDAQGRTIAVIGTPLDKSYPRQNAALQHLIAERHLVVSQFPKGYPTLPQNFPMRNRTMALISDATVIIEAGETSGSISQGWEALRLGRGLFISKWITESTLKWPGKMIAHGAQVLSNENMENFFESLPERHETFEWDALAFGT